MVTLKHLAEQLNVSVSTVSKALHDSSEISPETIERVKALAKLLNYKPNKMALSLKKSKTSTIGVIIPNILNHFFAKVLYGIEMEASKQGYNIITCISNELFEKERNSLELLSNGSVDGYILSVAEQSQVNNITEHFLNILNKKLPIVMFDRILNTVDCCKVVIDDFKSANNATKHLLNEGRRHVALISCISDLSVGKLRTNGYLSALKTFKDYNSKPLILNIEQSENQEYEIESFLLNNKDIDGIVAIDNTSGVIALHKALSQGKQVPSQLSIIGFSDSNILPFTNPKLSTISQHPLQIGSKAVTMIIDKINNKEINENKQELIPAELILRETTL